MISGISKNSWPDVGLFKKKRTFTNRAIKALGMVTSTVALKQQLKNANTVASMDLFQRCCLMAPHPGQTVISAWISVSQKGQFKGVYLKLKPGASVLLETRRLGLCDHQQSLHVGTASPCDW